MTYFAPLHNRTLADFNGKNIDIGDPNQFGYRNQMLWCSPPLSHTMRRSLSPLSALQCHATLDKYSGKFAKKTHQNTRRTSNVSSSGPPDKVHRVKQTSQTLKQLQCGQFATCYRAERASRGQRRR